MQARSIGWLPPVYPPDWIGPWTRDHLHPDRELMHLCLDGGSNLQPRYVS